MLPYHGHLWHQGNKVTGGSLDQLIVIGVEGLGLSQPSFNREYEIGPLRTCDLEGITGVKVLPGKVTPANGEVPSLRGWARQELRSRRKDGPHGECCPTVFPIKPCEYHLVRQDLLGPYGKIHLKSSGAKPHLYRHIFVYLDGVLYQN